jgi:predicted transcriptional regulator
LPKQKIGLAHAVRFDDDVWRKVCELAETDECTASDIVRYAVAEYLARNYAKVGSSYRQAEEDARDHVRMYHNGYIDPKCEYCEIWFNPLALGRASDPGDLTLPDEWRSSPIGTPTPDIP